MGNQPAPCHCNTPEPIQIQPFVPPTEDDEVCCGPPAGPPAGPHERPGYVICGFIDRFLTIGNHEIPIARTRLGLSDWMGTLKARLGIGRNDYRIAPGLYGIGTPAADSPVLVTANYKLTFDTLRRALVADDVWVLVVDTRGINVWCAAGKGTFGTDEVVRSVRRSGLENIVNHRRLILPQLSATGVCARTVKKQCGFAVIWGPIRANDIPLFLRQGQTVNPEMRRVTFSLAERLVLVPVELSLAPKSAGWMVVAIFVLSGIGPGIFSFQEAWIRGLTALAGLTAGIIAGAAITPVLLPWLPGKAFSLKGAVAGAAAAMAVVACFWKGLAELEIATMFVFTTVVSSFVAMNFTGSSPFTSPTGVEKEMRRAMPIQAAALLLALGGWIGATFR